MFPIKCIILRVCAGSSGKKNRGVEQKPSCHFGTQWRAMDVPLWEAPLYKLPLYSDVTNRFQFRRSQISTSSSRPDLSQPPARLISQLEAHSKNASCAHSQSLVIRPVISAISFLALRAARRVLEVESKKKFRQSEPRENRDTVWTHVQL